MKQLIIVTFEILFLILFANLNQFSAGQSLLKLDLHKQSQRTKQQDKATKQLAWPASNSKNESTSSSTSFHTIEAQSVSQNAATSTNAGQPNTTVHVDANQDSDKEANSLATSSNESNKSVRLKRQSFHSRFQQPVTTNSIGLASLEPTTTAAPLQANEDDHTTTPTPTTTTATTTISDKTRGRVQHQNQQKQQQQRASSAPPPPPFKQSSSSSASTISITSQAVPSNELLSSELCYLSNGGSSLTLTVNEATQVGSVVGTIDVNGDPSLEGGNVELQLEGGSGSGGGDQQAPADQLNRFAQQTPSTASLSSLSSSSYALPPPGARQNRRLLGRRDTMSASSATSTAASSLTNKLAPSAISGGSSSYYSLLISPAPPTPSSIPASATPPLRLEPGTKELILARPLDKESAEGESSLVVNVRCRLSSSASSSAPAPSSGYATTIPIRLIITDANDHAPEFVGQQPYVINVSETTPVNSPLPSRDIQAVDRDSAGPHSTIHYHVVDNSAAPINGAAQINGDAAAGTGAAPMSSQQPPPTGWPANLSQHFAFTNPLEPILWLTQALDYESLPAASFMLTIVAQDQAEPEPLQSTAQVQVNVLDFDDQNPRFLDDKYTLVMDETQSNLVGQNLLVLPRNLRAEDGDRGIMAPIVYSFDSQSSSSFATTGVDAGANGLGSTTDALAASSLLGPNDANEANDSLTSSSSPPFVIESYLHLNPTTGELRLIRQWPAGVAPLTLVVRATQEDNRDRYALTTLTIARGPTSGSAGAGDSAAARTEPTATRANKQLSGPGSDGTDARQAARGIAFVQDRLSIQVPEGTPVNERIVRVRARHLAPDQQWGAADTPLAANSSQATTPPPSFAGDNQQVDLIGGDSKARGGDKSSRFSANNQDQQQQLRSQQLSSIRPINYQILDDQTNQFGINGMGEIFLRRSLDYEQRQEFKFRVLATFTKYSDICHVHVSVINVNDNKPKFTQMQYSFHLTESRLRSNLIGSIQAHDADLNDTVKYTIWTAASAANGTQQSNQATDQVTQQQKEQQRNCARSFEISAGTGQLSLRAGIRQLNISQCQLIIQAADSLGPPSGHHTQQARVSVYVAPQIIGRSISLFSQQQPKQSDQQGGDGSGASSSTAAWPSSSGSQAAYYVTNNNAGGGRSSSGQAGGRARQGADNRLLDDSHQGESSTPINTIVQLHAGTGGGAHEVTSAGQQQQQPPPIPVSSQRSSLATVMASLQHMARSVNFFEMPMSSALLLSVLLTFLVCLLLIVIVSMSVHVYKRRMKTRRRRHLTAAAHLRHAHLAASSTVSGGLGGPGGASGLMSPSYKSSSYTTTTSPSASSPSSSSSPSSASSSSWLTSASPPGQRQKHGGGQQQALKQQQLQALNGNKLACFDSGDAATRSASAAVEKTANLPSLKNNHNNNNNSDELATEIQTNKTDVSESTDSTTNCNLTESKTTTTTITDSTSSAAQLKIAANLCELKISTDCRPGSGGARERDTPAATYTKSSGGGDQLMTSGSAAKSVHSLVSSLVSSQTTDSYATPDAGKSIHPRHADADDDDDDDNDDDDEDDEDDDHSSDTLNCGHYSVNGTIEHHRKLQIGPNMQKCRASRQQAGMSDEHTNRMLDQMKFELAKQQRHVNGGSYMRPQIDRKPPTARAAAIASSGGEENSIEATIMGLVQPTNIRGSQRDALTGSCNTNASVLRNLVNKSIEKMNNCDRVAATRLKGATGNSGSGGGGGSSSSASEVRELMQGKPGIKAYRRLPLMNSLCRPVKSQLSSLVANGAKVAPLESLANGCDAANSRVAQQQPPPAPPPQPASKPSNSSGLMAMVRELGGGGTGEGGGAAAGGGGAASRQIRWPTGAIPQRIKKLTWDDELSCCNDEPDSASFDAITTNEQVGGTQQGRQHLAQDPSDDCYISPCLQLGAPMSPLGREHHYSPPRHYQQQQQQRQQMLATTGSSTSMKHNGPPPVPTSAPPPLATSSSVAFRALQASDSFYAGASAGATVQARNQNNCLDYTIVQSSQFHADSLGATGATCSSSAMPSVCQSSDQYPGAGGHQQAPSLSGQITSAAGRQQYLYEQNFITQERPYDQEAGHYYYEQSLMSSVGAGFGESSFNDHHIQQQQQHLSVSSSYQQDSIDFNQNNEHGTNCTNSMLTDTNSGQMNATYKLTQNYQDLKLMTTAVL